MYFSDKKSFRNYLWKINQYDERKALAIYQKFGFSEILSKRPTALNSWKTDCMPWNMTVIMA